MGKGQGMRHPYFLVALGLFSFAGMGILHKLGDRLRGRPLPIAVWAVVAAGLISGVRALTTHALALHPLPPPILLIAIPFGICTGLSLWMFQEGLRYGRIATSWLLINLSAGVPTVLSIVFYRETLGPKRILALLLVVVSMLLLWWDRRGASRALAGEQLTVTTEVL